MHCGRIGIGDDVQIDLNAVNDASINAGLRNERVRKGRSRAQGSMRCKQDEPGLRADRSIGTAEADACRLDHPCRERMHSIAERTCRAGQWHIEHHDLSADFHTAFGRGRPDQAIA
jgi:hypothetical protein